MRNVFLYRKTKLLRDIQKPNRKTSPRKETHKEKCSPTGRLKLKQKVRKPTGRPAPERRLANPNRTSET